MSKIVVDLVFTGIVAFVRLRNGNVAAVMPNAMHDTMHAHVPWIMVGKQNGSPALPFNLEKDGLLAIVGG